MPVSKKIINKIFIENFPAITFSDGTTDKFSSFEYFNNFVENELKFWEEFSKCRIVKNVYDTYSKVSSTLKLISIIDNEKDVSTTLSSLFNQINKLYFCTSKSKFSQFILGLTKINYQVADVAYQVLILKNKDTLNVNILDNFYGTAAAYDYLRTTIVDEEDKYAIERLSEITTNHLRETEVIKENHITLNEQYKIELEKALETINDSNKKDLTQIEDQKKIFELEKQKIIADFKNLRDVYNEELRLKEPAKYWNDLKDEYNKKGIYWTIATIGVGLVFSIILLLVFYNFPIWLKGQITPDHLKGFIVFALLVSVFTYLLSIFIKYATSCFHLSRDANERHQLTHIYLALMNEKVIQPAEREIILQSLFSRADTGLLKNDSGPAMPGTMSMLGIAEKFKKH